VPEEILVHIQEGEKRVAIVKDGKLDDFYIELERDQSILGNVYKGRVESILPSINGAFVNIGQERNGFLYLTDAVSPLVEQEMTGARKFLNNILNKKEIQRGKKVSKKSQIVPLKQGQELLVQVVKDPFANKGARLTTHISLAGRFVVYMPYDNHYGVSKKIEDQQERRRLREILNDLKFVKTGGFIVRTVSKQQPKRELIRDAKFLAKIWQQIVKLEEKKKAPALIYKEYDLLWKIVRDFLNDKVKALVVDSKESHTKLCKFVQTLIGRQMVNKVQHYTEKIPLFDARNISKQLEKIYDKRVYLKSGSHIVIEQTEGLAVVDVNSGKFRTNKSPEEAAFLVNLEAAPEIARQLRLRDLGGIIVIDFIDMIRAGHKRKVLEALEDGLSNDYAKTEVNRISPLGLVEMTRARAGKTVESISFQACPYCEGRGRVKIE